MKKILMKIIDFIIGEPLPSKQDRINELKAKIKELEESKDEYEKLQDFEYLEKISHS